MHGLQRVGGVQLRHAAAVVVDQHRLVVAQPAQVEFQRAEAEIHLRVQEGVHDRRLGAGILALPPGHLVRQQERHRAEQVAGIILEEDFPRAEFVRRVDDGIGEHDDQRLGTGIDQRRDLRAQMRFVERQEGVAGIVDALAHLADHRDRHDRLGAVGVGDVLLARLVEAFAVAAAARQRDRRLEPRRHQRADARALALDQRIGAERRRVAHRIDAAQHVADRLAQLGAARGQRPVEAEREIMVGGQRLAADADTVPDDEGVGERAADIDRDAAHQWRCPWRRGRASPGTGSSTSSRSAHCSFSASISSSMSRKGGWPGGRYSASTSVPHCGQ